MAAPRRASGLEGAGRRFRTEARTEGRAGVEFASPRPCHEGNGDDARGRASGHSARPGTAEDSRSSLSLPLFALTTAIARS